jgi:hypothetical protein
MMRFAERMVGSLGCVPWVGAHGVRTNPGLDDFTPWLLEKWLIGSVLRARRFL